MFLLQKSRMETIEKTFCNICLSIISDENSITDEIIGDVIDVLLLQLSAPETNIHVICNTCSVKLFAAFHFKATCMDTEDCIFPYINSEREVDLRDVYLKERGKGHLKGILEDERICRLCMQVVTCEFKSVEEVDADMLRKYIPEVNFSSTKDAIICKVCLNLLDIHTGFLTNCLKTNKKIDKICDDEIESHSSIKCEDIETKYEISYSDSPMDEVPVKTTNKSILRGKRKQHRLKNRVTSKKQTFKCDSCEFITKYKYNLAQHQSVKHKVVPEKDMYKCDLCEFKTSYKHNIKQHRQTHTDFADEEKNKCDFCDYKSGIKRNLARHKLRHYRDFSINQEYKCDSCDYKTVYKSQIRRHHLQHKDYIYKCDSCNYETSYKSSITTHLLTHQDIPDDEFYKCYSCHYKTRFKSEMSEHQLKHRNIKEEDMYKCDLCDHKTVHRNSLKKHRLKHKDIPEEQMFKCDLCDYKSTYRSDIMQHAFKHNYIPEKYMYKCNFCEYKAVYKKYLRHHKMKYKHFSVNHMYKCDSCDYKTTYEDRFTRHQLGHP